MQVPFYIFSRRHINGFLGPKSGDLGGGQKVYAETICALFVPWCLTRNSVQDDRLQVTLVQANSRSRDQKPGKHPNFEKKTHLSVERPWMRLFLLTHGSFLLTVERFLLTIDHFSFSTYNWSFLAYSFSFLTYSNSWSFFAYSWKVRQIKVLRDCKQRSLTVSKKAPTVSKKLPPKAILSNSAKWWFSLRMIWGFWGPGFRTS